VKLLLRNNEKIKIGIVGGGVQLGPLGTATTNKPVVPTPGDYDDGEINGMTIGMRNRSTRRKPAAVPLCPPQTPHVLLRREPGPPRGGKPTSNRLSYGTANPHMFYSDANPRHRAVGSLRLTA
jgi:hypothetical protein